MPVPAHASSNGNETGAAAVMPAGLTGLDVAEVRRRLEHRAEPQVRVSEKWIRFSALNDALIVGESIGAVPKVQIHLGPML
ncbi:hypothetical protein DC522_10660 [Microvirga sp. KLBC 81]|uniref:hypothetical protein n=1 Tax=Microvirga sp. KLBC 81 TaxID=1862707 RepID=UPI000D5245B9|nr:hypothetical protein [Microvirga sp. KLBC 81]PVE24327.1 hypothetical protein DC522_10660 [Microvirga sp. KLBC 81]